MTSPKTDVPEFPLAAAALADGPERPPRVREGFDKRFLRLLC